MDTHIRLARSGRTHPAVRLIAQLRELQELREQHLTAEYAEYAEYAEVTVSQSRLVGASRFVGLHVLCVHCGTNAVPAVLTEQRNDRENPVGLRALITTDQTD